MSEDLLPHPTRPGKHIDPETGILPASEWGAACSRGFVSDSRFQVGTEAVIKRTNRAQQRKNSKPEGAQR